MGLRDFSQHGEGRFLREWFERHKPRNKFLVDVGAYGKEISNTFGLLKRGWEGLLVEPSNMRYRILLEDVSGVKARVINCGVGESRGRLPLYIHTVGGHDSFLKGWGHSELTGEAPLVDIYSLKELMRDWGVPGNPDLLSIDTEGMDFVIMRKFFEEGGYRPRVIVTEVESYADVRGFYVGHGYKFLRHFGDAVFGNSVFVTIH